MSERIHLLAEYEIEELEELYDKMLELNRDYATAQHLLAQTNLKLQQRETKESHHDSAGQRLFQRPAKACIFLRTPIPERLLPGRFRPLIASTPKLSCGSIYPFRDADND